MILIAAELLRYFLFPRFPYTHAMIALLVSTLVQGAAPSDALRDLIFGYKREIDNPQLKLLYGGGLVSMLKPMTIVFFSGAWPFSCRHPFSTGVYPENQNEAKAVTLVFEGFRAKRFQASRALKPR